MKVVVLISTILRSGYGSALDDAFLSPPDATSSTPSSLFTPLVRLFFDFPSNTLLLSELYTLFETVLLSRSKALQQRLLLGGGLVAAVIQALQTEQQRRRDLEVWKKKREEEIQQQNDPCGGGDGVDNVDDEPPPPPSFPAPPVERLPPPADHLAHTLHIARLLEEKRYEVDGLDAALLAAPPPQLPLGSCASPAEWSWDVLFQSIVAPAMKEQDGADREGDYDMDGSGGEEDNNEDGDDDWPQWNQNSSGGDDGARRSAFDDDQPPPAIDDEEEEEEDEDD